MKFANQNPNLQSHSNTDAKKMLWRGSVYYSTQVDLPKQSNSNTDAAKMLWRGSVYYSTQVDLPKQSNSNTDAAKMLWRGSVYYSTQVDISKWFLNAYEAYDKGESTLPKPPFKLNEYKKVVSDRFYKSLQKIISTGELNPNTRKTLVKLKLLVTSE